MSGNWKKIIDRINISKPEGPFSADWEAMRRKIDEHPELNRKHRNRFARLRTILFMITLLLAGLAGWWFWPKESLIESNSASETFTRQPASSPSTGSKQTGNVVDDGISTHPKPEQPTLGLGNTPSISKNIEPDNQIAFFRPSMDTTLNHSGKNKGKGSFEVAPVTNSIPGKGGSLNDRGFNSGSNNPKNKQSSPEDDDNSKDRNSAGGELENEKYGDEAKGGSASEKLKTPDQENSIGINNEMQGKLTYPDDKNSDLNNKDHARYPVDSAGSDHTGLLTETPSEGKPSEVDTAKDDQSLEKLSVNDGDQNKKQPFISTPLKGLSITGINLSAGTAKDFNQQIGYGSGVDMDIQRGKFLLNAGIRYWSWRFEQSSQTYFEQIDTSFVTRFETHWEVVVDSYWVIEGPYQGGYRYDTSFITVTDTIHEIQLDTSSKLVKSTKRIRLSYIEIPVLAGYRFSFNRIAVDVHGGLIISRLAVSQAGEDYKTGTKYGVDVIFRPTLHYFIDPKWSVILRPGVRYGLAPAGGFKKGTLFGDLQLGISYHW